MNWKPFNPSAVSSPPGGWFSHAALVDLTRARLLVISGQMALDSEGSLVGDGDMARQTEQVFANLSAILTDQGATFEDVISIRTYVTDMSAISQYGSVRARYFQHHPPTSTTVQVTRLVHPAALVEVDVMAAVGDLPPVKPDGTGSSWS